MGHMHTKEFVVGAAVGSLLGSVAALLVAPKAGCELRDDLCGTYTNISNKTQALAKKGKSLAKHVSCNSSDLADMARCFLGRSKKRSKGWFSKEEEEDTTKDLLIGGMIGTVLGAGIGLLLAPKSGNALRRDLVDSYDDLSERAQDFTDDMTKKGKGFIKKANSKANKWLDLAKEIVENLADEAEEKGEDLADKFKGMLNNKKVNDVLDWARLGFRAWQGIQSRKRR